MKPKAPRDYLVDYLEEQGISSIWSRVKGLNKLAIAIELGKLRIVEGERKGRVEEVYRGVRKLRGWGKGKAEAFTASKGKAGVLGIETQPIRFVIDLGLWSFHNEWEKKKLLFQIQTSIGVLRDFLWDKNLIIASATKEVAERLRSFGFFGEIISEKYEAGEKLILLDPKGERILKKVEPNKTYIIGGIVDRDQRLRTRELGYELPGYRIELFGSTIGVPEEINKILAILLKNYFGKPLSTAIIEEMDKEDKIKRIRWEFSKGIFRPWLYGVNRIRALRWIKE